MKTYQFKWTQKGGWEDVRGTGDLSPQLVLCFGKRQVIEGREILKTLQAKFPDSKILLASTAGEILHDEAYDDSVVVTAIEFEKSRLAFVDVRMKEDETSESIGIRAADGLEKDGLKHVLVLSDGHHINGTGLVKGLTAQLPEDVAVTGGLVGDGVDFKKTVIGLNDEPEEKRVVLIGLYGDTLRVGFGSLGGWDPFGPERRITKSKSNVLYEIDGEPALKLYERYLGEDAKDLPSSGLLFPLRLQVPNGEKSPTHVVRTLLDIDREKQTLTFAGDMPEGAKIHLMKANLERLLDGASGAARLSSSGEAGWADLAILVSCVGRKLVLKERAYEEVEAVRHTIGERPAIIGLYSYGEICPTSPTEKQCQLHNQTMTITLIKE